MRRKRGRKKFTTTDEFNRKLDDLFNFVKCAKPGCTHTSRHHVIVDGLCSTCRGVGPIKRKPLSEAEVEREKALEEKFGEWS